MIIQHTVWKGNIRVNSYRAKSGSVSLNQCNVSHVFHEIVMNSRCLCVFVKANGNEQKRGQNHYTMAMSLISMSWNCDLSSFSFSFVNEQKGGQHHYTKCLSCLSQNCDLSSLSFVNEQKGGQNHYTKCLSCLSQNCDLSSYTTSMSSFCPLWPCLLH